MISLPACLTSIRGAPDVAARPARLHNNSLLPERLLTHYCLIVGGGEREKERKSLIVVSG